MGSSTSKAETQKIQELEIQDYIQQINSLIENCFQECVCSFRTRDLNSSEKTCLKNCVERMLSFQKRVEQRIAEQGIMAQRRFEEEQLRKK
ncbi:import inner membrane translocase subunit tim9 [Anaeramoeba ignava]|uniref:Mitochondrial import inner membrane translocase subunit n=1 Tax=Anaeramoeba ignava TaxID=1746090 RepID=A0A9Q0RGS6_ANAIG|nr:import inner membrane translocase subunit tim9 [Anaeramoeba ignava]